MINKNEEISYLEKTIQEREYALESNIYWMSPLGKEIFDATTSQKVL